MHKNQKININSNVNYHEMNTKTQCNSRLKHTGILEIKKHLWMQL